MMFHCVDGGTMSRLRPLSAADRCGGPLWECHHQKKQGTRDDYTVVTNKARDDYTVVTNTRDDYTVVTDKVSINRSMVTKKERNDCTVVNGTLADADKEKSL